ncbi:MAG: UDP-N-acetylmuramoyl-tripeptide--D-alanyl-D-alanine ligase [Actinobacteria bacterium]|nr:UDP-N-acetylmuramoyl-tripeptide--D-alanyl-D-alanine ligase [Actinomycetota bacterium]MBW3651150.1 UDP-N-acetylmuramoyl-tripeptide--D-alanyl-D-alanine ligase [Actinomycetota bacterium]
MTLVATGACLLAAALAGLRWLRVAQREHYLVGSCSRFAGRWWFGLGFNRLLAVGVGLNVVLSTVSPVFALLVALPVAVGPFGLHLRGTAPGPLRWTRRLRTLAVVWAGLCLATVALGALAGVPVPLAALVAAGAPAFLDAAVAITAPLEQRLARTFVDQATKKLASIGPTVIAITGSYGKTTTKGYTAHLIAGSRTVVPTPASFNNSAGLARAINENLLPGTEVFVAEMGTYGPGEIAQLCRWVRPSIAAITAIGPVHLERMRSEETIAAAKAEIFSTAETCVLNIDSPWLAPMVEQLRASGKRVVRCSSVEASADVRAAYVADALVVHLDGQELARVEGSDAAPTNVAVAVALARQVGVPPEVIARRLGGLPTAANRRSITKGSTGATFIDDTYNANPAGAEAALTTLRHYADKAAGIVVVTPGMVELGERQAGENERFAAAASEVATDIVIIGSTNRRALQAGAHQGRARVVMVDDRAGATAWVKENTGPDDVVLFENDLPDHFP